MKAIKNQKLAIGNPKTHPLPRGGTDLMTRSEPAPKVSFELKSITEDAEVRSIKSKMLQTMLYKHVTPNTR